ncbi:hypothetical protein ACFV9E_11955 [Streptomyces sp. NPDC059835]|uniref:hypothetical protein n=1 Tax=Streptomyces sp. NPDC059835 TaxID=3346967 RepID=UPI003646274C
MFRITRTSDDVTDGTATETHALSLLRRALTRHYDIEARPDGSAHITWARRQFDPHHDGRTVNTPRSLTLTPTTPIRSLPKTVLGDLKLIRTAPWNPRLETEGGLEVIEQGLFRIPPAATARLRDRGLITTDGDGYVRLTLTARIAVHAHQHRTHTTPPKGWTRPSDLGLTGNGLNKPGRRNGLHYSAGSWAHCPCGNLAAYTDTRDEARAKAREHRITETTRFLTHTLNP